MLFSHVIANNSIFFEYSSIQLDDIIGNDRWSHSIEKYIFKKKTIFREIMSSLLVRHNSMLCSRSFQLSSCRTPFVMIIEYLKWLWKSIVNDLKTRSILRANVNRTTTICFWIKFDKSKVKWDAIANMASVPNLTMIF